MTAKIILGVTASVAAKLTAKLVSSLQEIGEVKVLATPKSLYFWDQAKTGAELLSDADEWPGERYVKDQPVPHIALGEWADALVIAPLSANTLSKMAVGIADNLLTCTYCAWPVGKPVLFAPAMNTRMWDNPLTQEHVGVLLKRRYHHHVPPVEKMLACGTKGMGAMADIAAIADAVRRLFP